MTEFKERYGSWAMVAGAALGLGESFCISLAQKGINIIMIDNQEKQMLALSEKLMKDYDIKTITISANLFHSESISQIMKKSANVDVRFLIYNATYSKIQKFVTYSSDELQNYLNVNVATPLKLVHAFSRRLVDQQRSGGVLLMSSLSGLIGMKYIAPYAASKAFLWNLSESLYHELKSNNIDVMSCIAGSTATDAYLNTNPIYGFFRPQVQQPKKVTDLALKNMGRKALFIPGFWNRFNYFILQRLLPRKTASYFANRTIQKMYPHT